jgi:hypothetical protein
MTPRRDRARTAARTPRDEALTARPVQTARATEPKENISARLDTLSIEGRAAAATLAAAVEQLSEVLQRIGGIDARLASMESRLAVLGGGGNSDDKRKHSVSLKRFEDAEDEAGGEAGGDGSVRDGSKGVGTNSVVGTSPGWASRIAAAVFGIQAADLTRGREGSRLIHPTSPFVSGAVPF